MVKAQTIETLENAVFGFSISVLFSFMILAGIFESFRTVNTYLIILAAAFFSCAGAGLCILKSNNKKGDMNE